MKYCFAIFISMVVTFSAALYAEDPQGGYPDVDPLKESDPHSQAQEALIQILKEFSTIEIPKEEIERRYRTASAFHCLTYNSSKSYIDALPNQIQWRVKLSWLGPDKVTYSHVTNIKAPTRDYAAFYAYCQLWNTRNIPMNKVTSTLVTPIHDNRVDGENKT